MTGSIKPCAVVLEGLNDVFFKKKFSLKVCLKSVCDPANKSECMCVTYKIIPSGLSNWIPDDNVKA